jgi:hypothetical protein
MSAPHRWIRQESGVSCVLGEAARGGWHGDVADTRAPKPTYQQVMLKLVAGGRVARAGSKRATTYRAG